MASVVVSESLTKRFGELTAVDGLSFALEPGTITGFLGPNGAGKTTTLRMLLGLAAPTSGRALVFGEPYAALERPALRVGAVLEATDFHPGRSGRDHLRTLARAVDLTDARVEEVLRLVELDAAASRRVKGYSLGMRQRLGLASALLGDPELLILDEPANGLDPEGVRWLRDFLRAFAAKKRTVLISSHVLAEVAQVVDQVLIINRGKLVVESSLEQLTARVGGSVRIRTPDPARLLDALKREGIDASASNDHALLVTRSHERTCRRYRVRRGSADARARRGRFLAGRGVPRSNLGAAAVIAQTRAELLKIRSTRTTIGLVLGMLAIVVLFSLLCGLLTKTHDLTTKEDQLGLLGVGSLAGVFSALAGIMLVTSEYRYGTIRPTFLFSPRRSRVLAAKLAAGLLAGLGFGVDRWAARVRDRATQLSPDAALPSRSAAATSRCSQLGTIAGSAIWGAIGVGLGAIVRNQVGSIISLLAWGFVVENLLFAFVPSVGRFGPVHAAGRAHRTHDQTPPPACRRRRSSCSPGRPHSPSPAPRSPPAAM